jgi:hypothetical protein
MQWLDGENEALLVTPPTNTFAVRAIGAHRRVAGMLI